METFLIKASQLFLSLSILVLVHELGHFTFARIFKVRVEKFYLFFNPWFTLFKYKPKNSDTEYGLGWLPLGGYCKIAGMIDESMDKEQMAQPPQPYEFRSKPAGQRLLIMIGGVLFNFILALIIYSMVLFTWGDTYLPLKNMEMGLEYNETMKSIGFRDGDILLQAGGEELERINENTIRAITKADQVTVLRNNQKVNISIPPGLMQRFMKDEQIPVRVRFPMVIDKLAENNSPAALAGLLPGDSIVCIDGEVTPSYYDVVKKLDQRKSQEIAVSFYRKGEEQLVQLKTDSLGKMGVYPLTPYDLYPTVTATYGFFESFPAGIRLGINTLKGYVNDMQYVFTKEGASNLGGFGAIGNMFPPVWDWELFWMRTAFLSIILAFMNILPIPALDGGHVMFLLYEVIARRKPSDKFMEYAQIAGMILLFSLLIYANGNDLFRFFFK